jgi:hypothetical protein
LVSIPEVQIYRRVEEMKCKRCGQDIEADAPEGVNICGSCANDLRGEEDAEIMAAQAKAEVESMADINFEMTKDALEAARAAILDAIYCEDGLDGHTGSVVMEWITDILGDEKEYRPTIEGVSSQTQILEDKAFLHRDRLIQQARQEVAREIFEEIEKGCGGEGNEYVSLAELFMSDFWQSLKSKYLQEEKHNG